MYIQLYNQKINYCLQVSLLCLLCVRRLELFFFFSFSTFAVSSLCLSYLAYTIDDALICNCVINYRGARWCGHDAGLVQIKTSIDSHLHIISTLAIIPNCYFLWIYFHQKNTTPLHSAPKDMQKFHINFSSNCYQQKQIKLKLLYFRSFVSRLNEMLLIHLLYLMQRSDGDDRHNKCIFIR